MFLLLQTDVATLQAVSSGDVDGDAGADTIYRSSGRTGTTVALLQLLLLMMIVTDADAGLVEKLLQRVTAATVGDVGSAYSASTARC